MVNPEYMRLKSQIEFTAIIYLLTVKQDESNKDEMYWTLAYFSGNSVIHNLSKSYKIDDTDQNYKKKIQYIKNASCFNLCWWVRLFPVFKYK